MLKYLKKTGVAAAFNERGDLDFDAAFEQVQGRRRHSLFVGNVVRATFQVMRSVYAANSPREDVLGIVLTVAPVLDLVACAFESYGRARTDEVTFEIAMDQLLHAASVHEPERDDLVRAELLGCSVVARLLVGRLKRLASLLAEEHIDAVRAKIYADSGGGCNAEFAMVLGNNGTPPKQVAVAAGRVRAPRKDLTGNRRKGAMKQRVQSATKALALQIERKRSTLCVRRRAIYFRGRRPAALPITG